MITRQCVSQRPQAMAANRLAVRLRELGGIQSAPLRDHNRKPFLDKWTEKFNIALTGEPDKTAAAIKYLEAMLDHMSEYRASRPAGHAEAAVGTAAERADVGV